MNLQDLKKEIPYQWRVQSFSKNKPQASCVAYIDARDAMNLLDEVCGPEGWRDEYYQVKDTMFCRVGIKVGDDWVWKSDGGDVTDVEAKKGESSDAFKRACVKWGIGRFLYDKEIKYVAASAKKEGNNYPYVVDEDGQRVWDLTEYLNKTNKTTSKPATKVQATKSNTYPFPAEHLKGCDKCKDGVFTEKSSKFGAFYSCINYPACKRTIKLEDAEKWLKPEYIVAQAMGGSVEDIPFPIPEEFPS